VKIPTYVTTAMIARHAGKAQETVIRALKLTQTPVVHPIGVRGMRIELRDANRFLAVQWPDVPPMSAPQVFEEVLTTTAPPARREPTNSESLATLRKSKAQV